MGTLTKFPVGLAEQVASEAHKNQKYGDLPYTVHLHHVRSILIRFDYTHNSALLSAAILHDILEDTDLHIDALRAMFGDYITNIVQLVTDKAGKTRKERHENTYPLIAKNPDAILVKLADRIANVESALGYWDEMRLDKLEMYRKEQEYFKNTLFREDGNKKMWQHLDSLLAITPKTGA